MHETPAVPDGCMPAVSLRGPRRLPRGRRRRLCLHLPHRGVRLHGEDADAFTFEVEETAEGVTVTFFNHPGWEYTVVQAANGERSGTSPFRAPSDYPNYPGENSVRQGLYAARENGWFTRWDEAARAEMAEWLAQWGVTPTPALAEGLSSGALTPAQGAERILPVLLRPGIRLAAGAYRVARRGAGQLRLRLGAGLPALGGGAHLSPGGRAGNRVFRGNAAGAGLRALQPQPVRLDARQRRLRRAARS